VPGGWDGASARGSSRPPGARCPRYSTRPPFLWTSRLMVEGARPRRSAICRTDSPARRPRLISSRSLPRRRSGERSQDGTAYTAGATPPRAMITRLTTEAEQPTAVAISRRCSPIRTLRQISAMSPSRSTPYWTCRRRIPTPSAPRSDRWLRRCCADRLNPPRGSTAEPSVSSPVATHVGVAGQRQRSRAASDSPPAPEPHGP
jgi:hypothetical protein